MMTMTADISKFRATLLRVVNETKKAEVDVVNKALKDVAFRAASFTPKTTAGKISAGLPKQLVARMAAKYLKQKQGHFSKDELKSTMTAIRKRRRSGIGGLRAGWIPAIQALGGTYRGAKKKTNGSASHGTAKKATVWRMAGLIRNTVETTRFSTMTKSGAGVIPLSIEGLMKSIVFITRDRALYLERKRAIGNVLVKHSDR